MVGGGLYLVFHLLEAESAPYPSLADALWLPFYPAAAFAVVRLSKDVRRGRSATGWTDVLTAALGSTALLVLLIEPWASATAVGDPAAVATSLAYPVADAAIVALAVATFALYGWRPGRMWTLLLAGLLLRVIEDTGWLYEVAHGGYVHATLLDPLCPASMLLIGAAAWAPRPARPDRRREPAYTFLIPAAFSLTAIGVVAYDQFAGSHPVAVALALATLLAVIARGLLTIRETRQLAESRAQARTFRELSDAIPHIVWSARPDGRIEYLNQVGVDYAGQLRDDLLSTGWHQLVHPHDLDAMSAAWQRAVSSGDSYEVDAACEAATAATAGSQHAAHACRAGTAGPTAGSAPARTSMTSAPRARSWTTPSASRPRLWPYSRRCSQPRPWASASSIATAASCG